MASIYYLNNKEIGHNHEHDNGNRYARDKCQSLESFLVGTLILSNFPDLTALFRFFFPRRANGNTDGNADSNAKPEIS